jgi:hypothetical protein
MSSTETWEGAFEVFAQTDAALGIIVEEDERVWIPLSQIEAIHWEADKKHAVIVMAAWIAKKKGLIG